MIKLPSIEVIFKQRATSLIERSKRGTAILIVRDNTDKKITFKEYSSFAGVELDKEKFTPANYQYIKDVFAFGPYKVAVVRVDATTGLIAAALSIIERNIKNGWITIADGATEDFATLASWTKSKALEHKSYNTVCYKAAVTDCMQIVNFDNPKVDFVDARGEVTGEKYCPSIIGILASCNVEKSATNFKCGNLKHVEEVENSETAVGEGKFVLINDVDTVRVAVGVNSLTTTDGLNKTEDMKYIDTVEIMNLISDDISSVFRNEYLGNYKNNYDNQVLFISAINTYLTLLANDYILDNKYSNKADVDVESQRLAWLGTGKEEASGWDEQKVKNMAFKRTVFLTGDIKILGAMENLKFIVNLA